MWLLIAVFFEHNVLKASIGWQLQRLTNSKETKPKCCSRNILFGEAGQRLPQHLTLLRQRRSSCICRLDYEVPNKLSLMGQMTVWCLSKKISFSVWINWLNNWRHNILTFRLFQIRCWWSSYLDPIPRRTARVSVGTWAINGQYNENAL